jgi:hypothetical protein
MKKLTEHKTQTTYFNIETAVELPAYKNSTRVQLESMFLI